MILLGIERSIFFINNTCIYKLSKQEKVAFQNLSYNSAIFTVLLSQLEMHNSIWKTSYFVQWSIGEVKLHHMGMTHICAYITEWAVNSEVLWRVFIDPLDRVVINILNRRRAASFTFFCSLLPYLFQISFTSKLYLYMHVYILDYLSIYWKTHIIFFLRSLCTFVSSYFNFVLMWLSQ